MKFCEPDWTNQTYFNTGNGPSILVTPAYESTGTVFVLSYGDSNQSLTQVNQLVNPSPIASLGTMTILFFSL